MEEVVLNRNAGPPGGEDGLSKLVPLDEADGAGGGFGKVQAKFQAAYTGA